MCLASRPPTHPSLWWGAISHGPKTFRTGTTVYNKFTSRCYFSKVDPYGFERPDNFDYDIYDDFMARYLSVLAKRSQKWEQHFRKHLLAKSKVKKCTYMA